MVGRKQGHFQYHQAGQVTTGEPAIQKRRSPTASGQLHNSTIPLYF